MTPSKCHAWQVAGVPGLELRGELSHEGGRAVLADESVMLPAWTRADAALSYRTKTWDVSLNAQNLADKDYVRTTSGRLSIRPGSPRDFSLRFRQRL